MADIKRMPDKDKLKLSRFYFFGGFALLPLLWIVNFAWFFNEVLRNQRDYPEKKEIKGYVIKSAICASIAIPLIISWVVYFQLNRADLPWADAVSLRIPLGSP